MRKIFHIKTFIFIYYLFFVSNIYSQNILTIDSTSYYYFNSYPFVSNNVEYDDFLTSSVSCNRDSTSYFYLQKSILTSTQQPVLRLTEINDTLDKTSFIYSQKSTYHNYGFSKKIVHKISMILGYTIVEELPVVDNPANFAQSESSSQWLIFIILIDLILIVIINIIYNRYFTAMLPSLFLYRSSQKLFNDNNVLKFRAFQLGDILYFFNLSMFVFLIAKYFNIQLDFDSDLIFPLGIVVLLLLLAFNTIIMKVVAIACNNLITLKEYRFNQRLFYQFFAVLLTFFCLIIEYVKLPYQISLIYIAISIFIIIYLLKVYRAFQIFFYKRFSLFYLFLYFCTIEILPYAVVLKYYMTEFYHLE